MFKWVACLCAVLYFTLLIVGAPPEGEEQAAVADQVNDAEDVSATIEETPAQAEPTVVAEETIEVAAEPAPAPTPEIVTASLEEEPEERTTVTLTPATQTAATSEPITASENRGVGEIWIVTGSTVNLRAGATTQAAVLGRTKRGDSAEVMEMLDNGWAKVYILESGLEAYMSAKFLARNSG